MLAVGGTQLIHTVMINMYMKVPVVVLIYEKSRMSTDRVTLGLQY